MPTKTLPYFLLALAVVSAIIAIHIVAGLFALRRFRRIERTGARIAAALIVIMLDIPIVFATLIYKFYHPAFLDDAMKAIAVPFMVLQINAALFSFFMIADRIVAWMMRRRHRATPPLPLVTTAPPLQESMLSGRRQFIRGTGLALATGAFATSQTLKAMAETKTYRIERVVIKVPRLPEAFKGTTIAMIADIHSSVFMDREEMEVYKKEVMKLNAEMIVVVGDFVNSKLFEVYPFAEAFSGMTATLGVWGVTGNHDYYTGEIETVVREVEQSGIRLLRNANTPIRKGDSTLWLMGVDDNDIYDAKTYVKTGKTERGTIENMLKGIPNDAVKIALCHKPYPFEEYSQIGSDLMLSGHTHGGQIVITQMDNVNVSFAALASKYVAGLYKGYTRPDSQLYVTRGIGTVGIPVRMNCAPEITHITLV